MPVPTMPAVLGTPPHRAPSRSAATIVPTALATAIAAFIRAAPEKSAVMTRERDSRVRAMP
jgi:hypothetical protein